MGNRTEGKAGPGTFLKAYFQAENIRLSGCSNARSELLKYMDRLGVGGCLDNFENIRQTLSSSSRSWTKNNLPYHPEPIEIQEMLETAIRKASNG